MSSVVLWLCAALLQEAPLGAGDHVRELAVDGRARSYRVHVPESYNPATPTPVVLAFHGSTMNARMMASLSRLDEKADEAGFIAVYPNGTGVHKQFLVFTAGEDRAPAAPEGRPDDVKFTARLLDDLARCVNVDPRRVYATGLSNGGMLCYRLACELPGRFAAIAPVAGTLAVDVPAAARPIPIMHFHGTGDEIVPFGGPDDRVPETVHFLSVHDTLRRWAAANGCAADAVTIEVPDRVDDGTTVKRTTWEAGPAGAEIVLYTIENGGHTWPGNESAVLKKLLGRTTREISANDLMWEFFARHRLRE